MNQAITANALRFVGIASALTQQTMGELQVHRAGQEKAASLRDPVLEKLLAAGCVAGHQKEAAEAMLGSHATTLNLLSNAADVIIKLRGQNEKMAGDLGHGVDEKTSGIPGNATQARYDSVNDGYVGKKTSEKKASDLAILAILNK